MLVFPSANVGLVLPKNFGNVFMKSLYALKKNVDSVLRIFIYHASRVSPIIRVPGPTFSHLGLRSCVSCIISIPGIGSQISPLDCQVLGPGSHPLVEFLVLSLGSHL